MDFQKVDLTDLQSSVIHTATEHPDYTYKQIADDCNCSTSTVGRTLRSIRLPEKNRPSVPSTSSLDEHVRMIKHATIDALARIGDLIRSIEQHEREAVIPRAKFEYKLEQLKQEVASELSIKLTTTQSIETIANILKCRLTYYPTKEYTEDIFYAYYNKNLLPSRVDIEDFESLCDIISELADRWIEIYEEYILASGHGHEYKEAILRYQHIRDELRSTIQHLLQHSTEQLIHPDEIESKVEELRMEKILDTAKRIHELIAADTPLDVIIEQYHTLSQQVTPGRLPELNEPTASSLSASRLRRRLRNIDEKIAAIALQLEPLDVAKM